MSHLYHHQNLSHRLTQPPAHTANLHLHRAEPPSPNKTIALYPSRPNHCPFNLKATTFPALNHELPSVIQPLSQLLQPLPTSVKVQAFFDFPSQGINHVHARTQLLPCLWLWYSGRKKRKEKLKKQT